MGTIQRLYLYFIGTILGVFSLCLLLITGIIGIFAFLAGANGYQYYINQLVAIDQLFNAHYLGDPDETISSRRGKGNPDSPLRKLIDFLFGKNHCTKYIEEEEGDNHVG